MELEASAKIEVLSADQQKQLLAQQAKTLRGMWPAPPVKLKRSASVEVVSGAISHGQIYAVPFDRYEEIVRISISSPGTTPAAPVTAGWITLSSPSAPQYNFPGSGHPAASVLPCVVTDGASALRLFQGEGLWIDGDGLGAITNVFIELLILSWSTASPRRGQIAGI